MPNSLYKLFEHKCVLEVCVHIHSVIIQIHIVFFFYPFSRIRLFSDSCQNDVVLYRPLPGAIVLIDKPSYLRPALSDL